MIHFQLADLVPNATSVTKAYFAIWLTDSLTQANNLLHLTSPIRSILTQSLWLAKPTATLALASKIVNELSDYSQPKTLSETEKILKDHVWPRVIAIGMLTEYIHQVLLSEKNGQTLITSITQHTRDRDWIYRSIIDLNHLSLTDYLAEYGTRSDNDYELTSPRWHEISSELAKRKKNSIPHQSDPVPLPAHKLASLLAELLVLRSKTRKHCLYYIDILRTQLKYPLASTITLKPESSKSFGVSPGIVTGSILHITSNLQVIPPNTIGIFPNSSPEFTTQFPKCVGIVFLQGGITSHGAIVAREFGIPAITSPSLASLPIASKLTIDGSKGTWEVNS